MSCIKSILNTYLQPILNTKKNLPSCRFFPPPRMLRITPAAAPRGVCGTHDSTASKDPFAKWAESRCETDRFAP